MTYFEELCKEIGVPITTDENGLYTRYCKVLSLIFNEVLFSDDATLLSLEEKVEIAKKKFLKAFPYFAKTADN